MTIETPIWMQNGQYPAYADRRFIERIMRGTERVFDGLKVKQTGTGSDTVDVEVGAAAIAGDDEIEQGFYFVDVTGEETTASVSAPGSGVRTDVVVLRVNDTQAGGAFGDNATIELIEGGVVPESALALATIERTSGSPILDADITDVRPLGAWPYAVGTAGPPNVGVEGDLYIQVT